MKHLFLIIVLSIGSLGAALPAFALKSDREQIIVIDAGDMKADVHGGITIYNGKVLISQGTLKITADTVKVLSADEGIVQIIASMMVESTDLAHYEQQSDGQEGLISANAKLITYFPQEEKLRLSGSANLNQTENVFSGELLHYDLAKGQVDLQGNEDTRVKIILTPKNQ